MGVRRHRHWEISEAFPDLLLLDPERAKVPWQFPSRKTLLPGLRLLFSLVHILVYSVSMRRCVSFMQRILEITEAAAECREPECVRTDFPSAQ